MENQMFGGIIVGEGDSFFYRNGFHNDTFRDGLANNIHPCQSVSLLIHLCLDGFKYVRREVYRY